MLDNKDNHRVSTAVGTELGVKGDYIKYPKYIDYIIYIYIDLVIFRVYLYVHVSYITCNANGTSE